MFKPTVMSIDFETALICGTPSVLAYHPLFRAVSCAFAWRREDHSVRSVVKVGEKNIRRFLNRVLADNIPLICHNYQFEYSVLKCRFPGYEHLVQYDTARLIQMLDNGGQDREEYVGEMTLEQLEEEVLGLKRKNGLSLTACASRWLPAEFYGHKDKYHQLIRDRGGKKGKEGAYLHLLKEDELLAYNSEDANVTLQLYETAVEKLGDYNWHMDHQLYKSSARLISESKIQGIRVDRASLRTHCEGKTKELETIASDFQNKFKDEIREIEEELTAKAKGARKTEKGKDNVQAVKFNPKSTTQLAKLFCDKLEMEPKFTTATDKPSFSKKHLGQWGEGGRILMGQRRALIELKQGEKLLELSDYDDRWHIDLRATGTATNRFTGTGGLNAQGLSRTCKSLMGTIVPDEGKVFVSIDLSAGEPTCTSHYSKDYMYMAANFGMVGKAPYWNDDDVLMIDDIYLMAASFSPVAAKRMKEHFNADWNGMTFVEQWLADSEVIKSALKKEIRNLHKIWVLGLGYGMGAKKLWRSAIEAGYNDVTLSDAKKFSKKYWTVFKDVKKFSDALGARFTRQKYIETTFGYRLYPDAEYKAFNYLIQSTVSGIMHTLNYLFFSRQEKARFITVIHDELILEVAKEDIQETKEIWNECVRELNRQLGWDVNIRTGWVEGRSMYEAK